MVNAHTPFDEQLDAYLCFLKVERGLANNTLEAYSRDLADFVRAMIGRGLLDGARVQTEDVSAWVRGLSQLGLARSSQKRMLVAVRGLFRFLVGKYDWPQNPCDHVALPKQAKTLPSVIAFDEVKRILMEASLRDRALVALWYGAGLRVSEAVKLEVGALQLDAGLIRVYGKGAKERIVPLGSSSCEILQAYLEQERPNYLRGETSDYLFPGRGKTGALTRQAAFCIIRRLGRAAGVSGKISPHTTGPGGGGRLHWL
ncbi:MAG: tyrosine-type recombinase/integrase [Myxococcota bacterium]